MNPRYRLGIDIGGTFTDATLLDESTGKISTGKVSTTPADPSRGFMEAVRWVAEELRREGIEAVAVCLLHAYVNPVHERCIGAILREVLPEALVSLSSDVAPEFREYRRASTTVGSVGSVR